MIKVSNHGDSVCTLLCRAVLTEHQAVPDAIHRSILCIRSPGEKQTAPISRRRSENFKISPHGENQASNKWKRQTAVVSSQQQYEGTYTYSTAHGSQLRGTAP